MNFLTRPVFLFTPDWSGAVARSLKFDLRAADIGYGATFYEPTEDWTVNGWQFVVTLPTPTDVLAFDAFIANLLGPLNGFWLPVPIAAMQVVSAASTSVFTITGESFSLTWNARPDIYLLFTFADGTQTGAQIQNVVDNGDGTETVTLTAALPQNPNGSTTVAKLHYVRLAKDEEDGEFFAEGAQTRTVNVIELPKEYAAAQTGLQPVYLFHFYAKAPFNLDWRFTSFAANFVSQKNLFTSYPIDFSNVTNVSDATRDDVSITAKRDLQSPLAMFFPVPFSGTLFVDIFAVDFSAPDVQTLLFSGRVTQVENDGQKYSATAESRRGFLRRKVPRTYKADTCQNVLYDQNTCRAGRAFYEMPVTVAGISAATVRPTQVTVNFLLPNFAVRFQAANYFAQGLFESGVGVSYEARTILSSSYNAGAQVLTLVLNQPLQLTQVGARAQIVAGCDHTAATCQNKFNNWKNFTGFVTIPDRNPTLRGVNGNTVAAGGK